MHKEVEIILFKGAEHLLSFREWEDHASQALHYDLLAAKNMLTFWSNLKSAARDMGTRAGPAHELTRTADTTYRVGIKLTEHSQLATQHYERAIQINPRSPQVRERRVQSRRGPEPYARCCGTTPASSWT